LLDDIRYAVEELTKAHNSIEVKSASELFTGFVTRKCNDLQMENEEFSSIKEKLVERGSQFASRTNKCGKKISQIAMSFIRDDMVVLTHGYSVLVNNVLLTAQEQGKRFRVIVTESRPGCHMLKTVEELLSHDIPVTIIPDTSVAYIMSDVDLVLIGSVAVVESGGILNTIGTYQISLIASALNTPVYCVAQSFKFTRLYPLSQKEIPEEKAGRLVVANSWMEYSLLKERYPDLTVETCSLDYTPPNYLTLLFTDLGVLTPSAVSDELIQLYS